MNVYDFDDTLYKGDSTQAFFRYQYPRHPRMLLHLPKQIKSFLRFLVGLEDKTAMKETMYGAFAYVPNIKEEVLHFWQIAQNDFKAYYASLHEEDDVVISASPRFLLEPAMELLEIKHLIASEIDAYTGKTLGKNCHGTEKLNRFVQAGFALEDVDAFYSDSLADAPFAQAAKQSFLVVGEEVMPWQNAKEPPFVSHSFMKMMAFALPLSVIMALCSQLMIGPFALVLGLLGLWKAYNQTATKPLSKDVKGIRRFLFSFLGAGLFPWCFKKCKVSHAFILGYGLHGVLLWILQQVSKR